MGHFLICKLGLCFRPVPKIPIDTIHCHVMHLWLHSVYTNEYQYMWVFYRVYFAVILLMSGIFLFTLQKQA